MKFGFSWMTIVFLIQDSRKSSFSIQSVSGIESVRPQGAGDLAIDSERGVAVR